MEPSQALSVSLGLLSLAVAGLVVAAARHAGTGTRVTVGVSVWMALTGVAAGVGAISFETRPPTMLIVLAVAVGLTTWVAFSPLGTKLAATTPIGWLVGFQVFRVPVELWLHRGYSEGVFGVQMTYAGLNFDIVSGATAAVVGWLAWRGVIGRGWILAWNIMGTLLLVNIVTIAVLSAPLPFRVFTDGPPNTYVTGFPGIWLPAVLVQAALLGHLLVFRWTAGLAPRAERSPR